MQFQAGLLVAILCCSFASGQTQARSGNDRPSPSTEMNGVSHDDMAHMPMGKANPGDNETSAHVMHSMEGHMDMGPHMKMTSMRRSEPGDAERARQVVEAARQVSKKYMDYHAALNDGFKIFLPDVPQKIYHFTNSGYAIEAQFRFDPEHPTSLLYEKYGNNYKLVGVMYTAPKRFTEDQLNERIPLSVAQWHEHVNLCIAPAGRRAEMLSPHAQFGLRGSITTEEACDAAGGTFHPVVFNWMVHVYPFKQDQARIWSVERQHAD